MKKYESSLILVLRIDFFYDIKKSNEWFHHRAISMSSIATLLFLDTILIL